jgi:ferritin-like metal-binding protein YciE
LNLAIPTTVSRSWSKRACLGADAKTKDNDVLDELTRSAKSLIGDIDDAPLRDAAIIESGNKVEHYEIAVYGWPHSPGS